MIVRCPWGECKEALTRRVGPKGSIFTLLAPPEEGGTSWAPLTTDLRASCTQHEILDGAARASQASEGPLSKDPAFPARKIPTPYAATCKRDSCS